jgi:hypothetical protein
MSSIELLDFSQEPMGNTVVTPSPIGSNLQMLEFKIWDEFVMLRVR